MADDYTMFTAGIPLPKHPVWREYPMKSLYLANLINEFCIYLTDSISIYGYAVGVVEIRNSRWYLGFDGKPDPDSYEYYLHVEVDAYNIEAITKELTPFDIADVWKGYMYLMLKSNPDFEEQMLGNIERLGYEIAVCKQGINHHNIIKELFGHDMDNEHNPSEVPPLENISPQ